MPFISAPNGCRVSVVGRYQGQTLINTFNAHLTTPPARADIEALMGAIRDAWIANMLDNLNVEYSFARIVGLGLTDEVDFRLEEFISGEVGATTGEPLPGNVAFSVKRQSGLSGRSARGRVYIGGFDYGQLEGANMIGEAWATDVVQALTAVHDAINATDWEEVIWSYYTGGAPREFGYPYGVDSYGYVDLNVDSMRRRLTGRGI